MNKVDLNFIQQNSPDGGFLQSEAWRKFQEAYGRKTFHLESEGFWANIIEHTLPVVGKYFYIPRGPIAIANCNKESFFELAKKEQINWIRIDVESEEKLNLFKREFNCEIRKAPHDVQPKQVFIIDITKSETEILAEMKSKTRYNIRLAEKKGVRVFVSQEKKYLDRFCELVDVTATRQGITSHSKEYYQKMFQTIPAENIKLYCAEFEGEIIATNAVIFFGDTATYLHGASDDKFRNVMAPYLLQWSQIQDAKKYGCKQYDFGGIELGGESKWAGITNFKLGFSPNTKPLEFLGSYDVIINNSKYFVYRLLQRLKGLC